MGASRDARERTTAADARDAAAEARDQAADQRASTAERSDHAADVRDAVAAERDAIAGAREADLDSWQQHVDQWAAELSLDVPDRSGASRASSRHRAGGGICRHRRATHRLGDRRRTPHLSSRSCRRDDRRRHLGQRHSQRR